MNRQQIYLIGMVLSLLCVAGVYYWEYRYMSDMAKPGSRELLVGSALIIVYTWPIWLGFPILSVIFRKRLLVWQPVFAWLPACLIIFPFIIRLIN